jgi:BlaI family penicillinase repressor
MANGPSLSEAEMEVLKVLWDLGPSNVRAINSELQCRGRSWAYTTVSTLLQRLTAKEVVASTSETVPHVYRATVLRDALLERRLKEAADDLCDGAAAPLVLALVQGNRFTTEELSRFQSLLDTARRQANERQ